jgi:hypothetical protein
MVQHLVGTDPFCNAWSTQSWQERSQARRPGEIERRQNDPGFIEWDVVREGIVLFDASSPHAPKQLAGSISWKTLSNSGLAVRRDGEGGQRALLMNILRRPHAAISGGGSPPRQL